MSAPDRVGQASAPVVAVLLLAGVGACNLGIERAPEVTALSRAQHDSRFPIASGKHGGVDCNSCHGEFDTFRQFTCLGCHQKQDTDPIHGGMPGYAYDSASCYVCHPRGDGDDAAFDHVKFPIKAPSRHAGISCAQCHTDPNDRTKFDCTSCHTAPKTDPAHAGVAGYAWSSPSCYACHPTGEAFGGANHAKYFPIGAGTQHDQISCSTCHVDPANRKVLDCTTCHKATATATQHSVVAGYQHSSPLCIRCHADAQVNPVSGHLPFRITSGYKHSKSNIGGQASCILCHPGFRTDKPWGADFKGIDCLTCHRRADMDDTHQAMPAYRYQSVTCITSGCHANGRKP